MKRYIKSSTSLDLKVGDVVQAKSSPENPFGIFSQWSYIGIIEEIGNSYIIIRDENNTRHRINLKNQYGDPIITRIDDKDFKFPSELFSHTFYGNGVRHSKQEIIDFLRNTDKPIKYIYGLGYRNPTINNKPITLQEALDIVNKEFGMLDVKEYPKYVHLNAYSGNDMW